MNVNVPLGELSGFWSLLWPQLYLMVSHNYGYVFGVPMTRTYFGVYTIVPYRETTIQRYQRRDRKFDDRACVGC